MIKEIHFVYSGYAYTPIMGERPVFRVGFERAGRAESIGVRANDAIEAHQLAAKELGVPWIMMGK